MILDVKRSMLRGAGRSGGRIGDAGRLAARWHRRLHFAVRDTGIGIPAGEAGAGLRGLRAGRQLDDAQVRRHRAGPGDLHPAGRADGRPDLGRKRGRRGAARSISRPGSACRPNMPARRRSSRRPASADMRVLVVDDNATQPRILEEILRSWEMRPDGRRQRRRSAPGRRAGPGGGDPYRLLLVDAGMPESDGFHLAQELKQVPELRRAGDHDAHLRRPARARLAVRRSGVAAYLMKPVKQSELFDAIMLALASRPPRTSRPWPASTRQPTAAAADPAGRGQPGQPEAGGGLARQAGAPGHHRQQRPGSHRAGRLQEAPQRGRGQEVGAVEATWSGGGLRDRPPDEDGRDREDRRQTSRPGAEATREQVGEQEPDEDERGRGSNDRRDPDEGDEQERREADGEGDPRPALDPARSSPASDAPHAALPCPAGRVPARLRSVPAAVVAGTANSPDTTKRPKEPLSILGRPPIRYKYRTGLSMRASTGPP